MMHHPPHPGEIIREDFFAPLGLSMTEAANRLAMPQTVLSRVLNGKASVSLDLAVRLEQAGASTAQGSPCRPTMICGKPGSVSRRT